MSAATAVKLSVSLSRDGAVTLVSASQRSPSQNCLWSESPSASVSAMYARLPSSSKPRRDTATVSRLSTVALSDDGLWLPAYARISSVGGALTLAAKASGADAAPMRS